MTTPDLLEAAKAAFPLLTDWDVDPESDDDGQWEADCHAFNAETGLTYGPLTHREFKSWSVRRDRRVRNDLAAAISAEEARRSQPADENVPRHILESIRKRHHDHEDRCLWCGKPWPCVDYIDADAALAAVDPRDAEIRDLRALLGRCAADFARVRDYAPALDRTPVDNSGCEDCARAREHAWPPSRLCETHYSKAAQQERANDQLLATQDYPMREIARKALAAIRSAGVEPAPAQEVKASRPSPVRHGETCEKAAHSRTGYLHDENDDTPYDVDGLLYCGRCHGSIDR